MQLTELQNFVNYRRRDTTENFVSNQEIIDYLNEALRRVQSEWDWEWTRTSTTFSYTDGSFQYALSAIAVDNKSPISLFYDYSNPFEMVTPDTFMMLSSFSNNIFATDNLYLYVKSAFGSGNINYYYYSYYLAKTSAGSLQNKLSTSTDEPIIPDRFQPLLIDYAAARSYQKEGMTDDYSIAYKEYLTLLNKMKREYPAKRSRPITRMRHSNELTANRNLPLSKDNPLNQ